MADGIKTVPAWFARKQLPVILQSEIAECALVCLAMIARYYNYDVDLPSLRRRFNPSSRGMYLAQLISVAHTLGLESRAAKVNLEELSRISTPCILHWNLNHFVVLKRITQKGAEIHDPAHGKRLVSFKSLNQQYTGIVLELAPGPDFSPKRERRRISLHALTGNVHGLSSVVAQVLGIAITLEVLSLTLPFQLQWVLDQVLVTGDVSLLVLITLGFVLVSVLQTSLNAARAWILSWLGANLSAQWATNLASHLLRLPLSFFGRRDMGEIMSRFSSVQYIQTTLTGTFAEVVINGLTASLTLFVLCLYSLPLGLGVLGILLVYAILRTIVFRTQWLANEEQIMYVSRQQTLLMEAIRGMQTIKLANKEGERSSRIAGATLAAAMRSMRYQRFSQLFATFSQGLFGLQRVLLIGFGGVLALRNYFTAGMLIAFVIYADQFLSRAGSLVDKLVDFRLLRLHLERIADIALQPPESIDGGSSGGGPIQPNLAVRELSFRYGANDPWIFRNVYLTVEPGESVAIVGPSGCGKSTLVKLIVGLLEPTEGQIEVGGIEIRRFGLANYRRMIGTVMQNDNLFAGSIADNISFFDPHASLDAIIAAARMAYIHDDITTMAMGYESLVGDMGSSLSGGQQQRVILARAFYRQPRILVLDEATSHLDVDLERKINAAIRESLATRIIIAHRPETIASADRVIDFREISAALSH